MAQEEATMAQPVTRRTFTVDEYYRMAEVGILHEDDRVELIDGEIVQMAAVGTRHTACVSKITRVLVRQLPDDLLVRVQDPLRLSNRTELQPDFVVIPFRSDYYVEAHPVPADTLLVIEVAGSSLRYDRKIKLPLYARAGVPEVWIVDLGAQQVVVHQQPAAETYESAVQCGKGERFLSQVRKEQPFEVDDLLP